MKRFAAAPARRRLRRNGPRTGDRAIAYDLIYALGAAKDYAGEARAIAELIRQRQPDADTLLDVACGTGQHLFHLRRYFQRVEGLDISPAMRDAASARLREIPVHLGDMREFRLGRVFSAVVCLFSSIGYARSVAELQQSLRCMAEHTVSGGVLVLEPWYTPQQWAPGSVHPGTVRLGDRYVTRMCYTGQDGMTSTMTMHYVIGERGGGLRHWTEQHRLTLFTRQQYQDALFNAGYEAIEWLPGAYDERPRIIATRSCLDSIPCH